MQGGVVVEMNSVNIKLEPDADVDCLINSLVEGAVNCSNLCSSSDTSSNSESGFFDDVIFGREDSLVDCSRKRKKSASLEESSLLPFLLSELIGTTCQDAAQSSSSSATKASSPFPEVSPSEHAMLLSLDSDSAKTSRSPDSDSTKKLPYKCDLCHREFNCLKYLESHRLVHVKNDEKAFVEKHICPVCGKEYDQKTNLKYHMRQHTGERPHVCEVCGDSFSHPSTLRNHKYIHTRPFSCSICGQRFSRQSTRKNHMMSLHSAEVTQALLCDEQFETALQPCSQSMLAIFAQYETPIW